MLEVMRSVAYVPSRNAPARPGSCDQLVQRVVEALGLEHPRALDLAAGADDRVARACQHLGIRIDRPRAGLQLAHEALVQAGEVALARLVQPQVGAARARSRCDRRASQGCSIRLNQPMKRVNAMPRNAVGEQKAQGLCHGAVTPSAYTGDRAWCSANRFFSTASARDRRGAGLPGAQGPPRAVAGQAPFARRPCAPRAPRRRAGSGLRLMTMTHSSASTARRERSRRAAAPRLPPLGALPAALRSTLELTAQAKESLSDLQFTGRLPRAVPVQRTTCAEHLPVGAFLQSRARA